MRIWYTVTECNRPKLGIVVKVYEDHKYLVREYNPVKNQPTTRFVFFTQIIVVCKGE